jgi:hypothetical protein
LEIQYGSNRSLLPQAVNIVSTSGTGAQEEFGKNLGVVHTSLPGQRIAVSISVCHVENGVGFVAVLLQYLDSIGRRENEEGFFLMTSSILQSGLMHKTIDKLAPIADVALVLLLRQALAEWARVVKGYERQLHSLDPVAIRLGQRRVNAPEHAHWGHVTCEACGDIFALVPLRWAGSEAPASFWTSLVGGFCTVGRVPRPRAIP